jgi:hypothetical protein
MTALDPIDRELLDFLCACAHHRVRIVQIKAPRLASLRRLRHGGHVGIDDHLPSGSALLNWIERQRTKSEAANASVAVDEPPAPKAAEQGGGGDARCNAPPPKPKRIYQRKTKAPLGDLRFAINRENPSTEGPHPSAEPPSLAPTADESAVVPKDLGSARPAFGEPSEPVDLKVNAAVRRDPTQRPDTPTLDHAEQERRRTARIAQSYKRRVRTRAQNLIDAGEETGARGRNVEVRGAMKELIENADAKARLLDPVEQAKTVIRIAGWNCFGAAIRGGPVGKFYIGAKLVDETELLAFAERLRTTRRRRAG